MNKEQFMRDFRMQVEKINREKEVIRLKEI